MAKVDGKVGAGGRLWIWGFMKKGLGSGLRSFMVYCVTYLFGAGGLRVGIGVWGLGFGVWNLGFGVWGSGFGVVVLGYSVWGLGLGVWGLGFRA